MMSCFAKNRCGGRDRGGSFNPESAYLASLREAFKRNLRAVWPHHLLGG
jgi:hypothetical protein